MHLLLYLYPSIRLHSLSWFTPPPKKRDSSLAFCLHFQPSRVGQFTHAALFIQSSCRTYRLVVFFSEMGKVEFSPSRFTRCSKSLSFAQGRKSLLQKQLRSGRSPLGQCINMLYNYPERHSLENYWSYLEVNCSSLCLNYPSPGLSSLRWARRRDVFAVIFSMLQQPSSAEKKKTPQIIHSVCLGSPPCTVTRYYISALSSLPLLLLYLFSQPLPLSTLINFSSLPPVSSPDWQKAKTNKAAASYVFRQVTSPLFSAFFFFLLPSVRVHAV